MPASISIANCAHDDVRARLMTEASLALMKTCASNLLVRLDYQKRSAPDHRHSALAAGHALRALRGITQTCLADATLPDR